MPCKAAPPTPPFQDRSRISNRDVQLSASPVRRQSDVSGALPLETRFFRHGPTQGGDVLGAQAAAAQPQRPQPRGVVEVGGQRLQTSTNQLIPGDVQLLQLREELQKRRCRQQEEKVVYYNSIRLMLVKKNSCLTGRNLEQNPALTQAGLGEDRTEKGGQKEMEVRRGG